METKNTIDIKLANICLDYSSLYPWQVLQPMPVNIKKLDKLTDYNNNAEVDEILK